MKLTPLAFLAAVERSLTDLLPAAAPTGGQWTFQRFINLAEQSGSLEVQRECGGEPRAAGVIHVRTMVGAQDAFLQGWILPEGAEDRVPFLLRESGGPKSEEEIYGLADGWATVLATTASTPTDASPSEPAKAGKPAARPKATVAKKQAAL
jgi:hypothetical protein